MACHLGTDDLNKELQIVYLVRTDGSVMAAYSNSSFQHKCMPVMIHLRQLDTSPDVLVAIAQSTN